MISLDFLQNRFSIKWLTNFHFFYIACPTFLSILFSTSLFSSTLHFKVLCGFQMSTEVLPGNKIQYLMFRSFYWNIKCPVFTRKLSLSNEYSISQIIFLSDLQRFPYEISIGEQYQSLARTFLKFIKYVTSSISTVIYFIDRKIIWFINYTDF